MPDFTMCCQEKNNELCPKLLECYRAVAKPSQWQSFADFKYICNEENNYKMLTEIRDNDIIQEKYKK
jgi:hypothetical protein